MAKSPFSRPHLFVISTILLIALVLAACQNLIPPTQEQVAQTPAVEEDLPTAEPLAPAQKTEVTFQVQVPENTPEGTGVFLVLLDEVTGLSLNAESYPMESTDTAGIYSLSLPFPLGAAVTYRYERQADGVNVAEHSSDGRPVRYRIYHVEGPGEVKDVVSRWTDTEFVGPAGRIMGQIKDQESGEGIPQLLVTAGGMQTQTSSDGSFILEGLPPGTHNLVAYALDGTYRTFQQGATVAADSTTPAQITMQQAPLVNVIFSVKFPEGTPPAVPVRLAGNLIQLGNTFASLDGGVSTEATRMPVLDPLPDGTYNLSLNLPAGAYLSYKYTLGDGFWNAEHNADGAFNLRQVVVPDQDTLIEDKVETWQVGKNGPLVFSVNVPADTPPGDVITLQLNPAFGWMQPIPMWRLSDSRWAYFLYSPLNLPGDLAYRYCRNSQCGVADDSATAGPDSPGRSVTPAEGQQIIEDQIESWSQWGNSAEILPIAENILPRKFFANGIEFEPAYHPSWQAKIPAALDSLRELGANWVVLSPTWTYTINSLPILQQVAGRDALWQDISDQIQQGKLRGFNTAIYPQPGFLMDPTEWWQTAPRDFGWWLVWFEQYQNFILHHADLAQRNQAAALIIGGGDWILPALPGGRLPDGSPSGAPADADARWKNLIGDIRSRYNGPLIWALPIENITEAPDFVSDVDMIYVTVDTALSQELNAPPEDLEKEAGRLLDMKVLPIHYLFNKPVLISLEYPSADGATAGCVIDGQGCAGQGALTAGQPDQAGITLDLEEQMAAYSAWLNAVNVRDWINGIYAGGYYPPAALQDKSYSVHGKQVESLLEGYFQKWSPPAADQQN